MCEAVTLLSRSQREGFEDDAQAEIAPGKICGSRGGRDAAVEGFEMAA
jgi:hypothetical protein